MDWYRSLRRTRRLRRLVALLVVLLVLAVISVVIAVDQSNTLTAQQKVTLAQALVAKAATLDAQPDAAMLLALATYRLNPSPETRSALLSAGKVPRSRTVRTGQSWPSAVPTTRSPCMTRQPAVSSAG